MIVLTGPPFEWEVGADTAVTIGVFDGVHIGHRRVIADLIALAESSSLSPTIVTFDPHPLSILAPERAPKMLTSVFQRVDQFRQLGVEIAGVLDFPDIRDLPPDQFCEEVLFRALRARRWLWGRTSVLDATVGETPFCSHKKGIVSASRSPLSICSGISRVWSRRPGSAS